MEMKLHKFVMSSLQRSTGDNGLLVRILESHLNGVSVVFDFHFVHHIRGEFERQVGLFDDIIGLDINRRLFLFRFPTFWIMFTPQGWSCINQSLISIEYSSEWHQGE